MATVLETKVPTHRLAGIQYKNYPMVHETGAHRDCQLAHETNTSVLRSF